MSEKVEGITLKGFKYPLLKYTMTNDDGIGISNEMQEDTVYVEFERGILLMIMSRDK
jgi:thiamine pyrophosphokinase